MVDQVLGDLGSVSSGTMRTEDLLDSLGDALRALAIRADNPDHIKLCNEADAAYEVLNGDHRNRSVDECAKIEEEAPEIVDELMTALNDYAPVFCYFGSHEGDSADYGFWFSNDMFDDAVRCGECVKIETGNDIAQAFADNPEADTVAAVSDHGNVTIYGRIISYKELLSIV